MLRLLLALLLIFQVCSSFRTQRFQRLSAPQWNTRFGFKSSAENDSIVNVYDFGAKGDGKTDDTAAFAKALGSLANSGGIVFAPSGSYRINGHLVIPPSVTLEGTFRCVPSHSHETPHKGTLLMAYEGRGNLDGTPFITISEDSTVRGVVIYYPEVSKTAAPVAYPWTLDMVGTNSAILDVECLNCYNAIRAVDAGRHYIARVQGQPINTGVFIDETYDIGRVEDVHFNPWFSTDKVFLQHQLLYGRAFVIARSDWEYFFNTFAFGYAVGYDFIESSSGSCNGNFLGIGADMMTNVSVRVSAADPWGILITNGEFTAFVDPKFGTAHGPSYQVYVTSSNLGAVRFENTAFWGQSASVAVVQSGQVSFSNCIFNTWKTGNYAILAYGGSLQVANSDFQKDEKQIYVDEKVNRAIINGNMVTGTVRFALNNERHAVATNLGTA